MKKTKVIRLMLVALMAAGVANASVIWSDDFEAYDIETDADFSIGGVATGNWTGDPLAGSRTFSTSNYGGSKLWISNTDGTSITSAGITVDSATEYAFKVNLVAETYRTGRGVDASYDILVGADAASALSIIGGPVTVIARGDDEITPDSYDDQYFTEIFTTGAINAGDQLFVKITRIGTSAGLSAAWFGVDNASIVVPEPATMLLLGLGGFAAIRRKK